MKFHMLMLMNAWMMLVLLKCMCQIQCLTLGCYTCHRPKMSEIVKMLEGGDGVAEKWEPMKKY